MPNPQYEMRDLQARLSSQHSTISTENCRHLVRHLSIFTFEEYINHVISSTEGIRSNVPVTEMTVTQYSWPIALYLLQTNRFINRSLTYLQKNGEWKGKY